MNFKSLITLLSIMQASNAAPLPMPMAIPNAEPVMVTVTENPVTTVIPVAAVHIGNDYTYTTTLTTLNTAQTTYNNLVGNENVQAQPQQTTNTNLVTDPLTASATPAPTTSTQEEQTESQAPETKTSIYTDDKGVVHVFVTINEHVKVDQNGNTITVEYQTPTPAPAPATTNPNLVQNTTPAANTAANTAATTTAKTTNETTANTSVESTTSSTETTESSTESSTSSTESSTSSTTPSTTSTTPPTTSTSSSLLTTSSSSEFTTQDNFVTTWSNGEVFYSVLPEGLVEPENVAPIVALTTTTLANTAEAQTTTAELSLVSSDSKLLLATLTEGLPMDKNIKVTFNNPATISVTNTQSVSTPIIVSSSTTSSSTSTTSSSLSTAQGNAVQTSTPDGLLSDDSSVENTSSVSSASASATAAIDSSKYLTKTPYSLVYSPYNNDGTCKSYTTVLSDLQLIQSKGVKELRVYGNDCNYLTTVLPVAKKLGLMINQGFWISSAGANSIDAAVDDLIKYITSGAASYSWEIFSYFTVGNEAIIANYCSVDDLISKISQVRGKLEAAGYNGLITTSEPPVTFENNPQLCTEAQIDFVGINPHSYFDTYSSAETSGIFVKGQIELVKQYCGDKNIVVTETGYPNGGIQNGNNIPSPDNQRIAVQSILDVAGVDVTILSAFEDLWKNPGPYGIEQNFGIIQLLQ